MNSVLQALGLSLADEENEAWKNGVSLLEFGLLWWLLMSTFPKISHHIIITLWFVLGIFFGEGVFFSSNTRTTFFLCAPRTTFFYKLHVMFFKKNKNKPGNKKNKLQYLCGEIWQL